MPQKTYIFLTGATGYIGGSVLTRLLHHPNWPSYDITVLVRSPDKAKKLSSVAGINPVVGSYSDLQLLAQLASAADVVFACADADDFKAAGAILNGMKNRYERNQRTKLPILIHTSGTGVLVDDAAGMYATDEVYSDLDIEKLETLPLTQPHREVDLLLVKADQAGYVKTHIILPPTIYGLASGLLVDLNIQNKRSQQIPLLVAVSLDRAQAGMVGRGKNIWPNVHIDDVADLYIMLFDAMLSPTPPAHGRAGFYFGSNGEHTLASISKTIGTVLRARGKSATSKPSSFTPVELRKYFPKGTAAFGSNSRCRAERGRMLGWAPKYETEDMLASIEMEVDMCLGVH